MTHCNFSDKEKTKNYCENLKNRCEQMEINQIRQKITKNTKYILRASERPSPTADKMGTEVPADQRQATQSTLAAH